MMMQVRDVMTTSVVSVGPEASFQELVGLMLDHGIGGIQSTSVATVFDGVDHSLRHAHFQGLWLVRHPFELAVHLPRGCQDCDFAQARRIARLKA